MVCLASLISDVSLYYEMVEHGMAPQVIGHGQWHVDTKRTVVACGGIALADNHFIQTITDIASLPVAAVAHPPEGYTTLNGIVYFAILNRYSRITHGLSGGMHGVASLIRLFVLIEFYLEGWTFVFLDTEVDTSILGANAEATVQFARRQRELYAAFAIAVGGGLLLGNHLVVGIAQLELQRLVCHSGIVDGRLLFPHDGCDIDSLTRTVDSTIRKQTGMLAIVLALVIAVVAIAVLFRTVVVVSGVGKD